MAGVVDADGRGSQMTTPPTVPAERARSIEQFLYQEAALLDDRAFEQWLDMLDEDFSYVIPSVAVGVPDASDVNGDKRLYNSLYDDTKATIARRVRRMGMPTAWAENPPSRTCRLISNVHIVVDDGDALTVRSSFVLHKARFDYDSVIFIGTRLDRLRSRAGEGWGFAERKVRLIDSAIAHHNISVFF
jgi:3-phenylpropionate/cinnamic acid dioxygenase small subunit